mmetsp:Transcript_9739/g.30425  ORF Transcript_9739/g.30425 Transcript_9739/m.30425 type:complete len:249 (-) Transcript_9739:148-894(-)
MPSQTMVISSEGTAKRSTQIGPGQAPARPHPMPKRKVPTTRGVSTGFCLGGSSHEVPTSGPWGSRRSRSWKNGKVSKSADAMTKARLGSQAPERRSRKAATLLGLAMPLTTSPAPKARPLISSRTGTSFSASSLPRMAKATVPARINAATPPAAISAPAGQSSTATECCGSPSAVLLRVAATAALTMKHGTATQPRRVRRARPVSPWPLVHPLPKAVPAPIRRPPARRRRRRGHRSDVAKGGIASKPP